MPYRMTGRFFEACDCFVPCPCWFDNDPDEDECTGIVAWQVENGEVDGVDVTGLSVVSVSQHGGHRGGAHQMRVVLVIDEGAGEEQRTALDDAFSGRLGGPLGELSRLTGDVAGVEAAKIEFAADNGAVRLDVPKRVGVRSKLVRGSTKRPITIGDGQLATLLGSPGVVGKSSRYRLTIESGDIDIDVTGRSTTSGRFSYAHHG
jgi:hypothetical protein